MSITVSHFNTWAGSLYKEHCKDYYGYIKETAGNSDVFHLFEVHSQPDKKKEEFIMPVDSGHRVGPLHVRQLQFIERILLNTHQVYFTP